MYGLHVFVYTTSVPGAWASQKKLSDAPELELQTAVRSRVGENGG